MPNFQCCFCGNSIAVVRDDPVAIQISVQSESEESQQLWTHALCLRRVVRRDVPLLPSLPHGLSALPIDLAAQSASPTEIVLPFTAALEALDALAKADVRVLGWEGWVRMADGSVGHQDTPQGTGDLSDLPFENAVSVCRDTIHAAEREWKLSSSESRAELLFCISASAT